MEKEEEEEDITNELTCILPGELMLDILFRLSVKSLVKFSCVNKPWFNLVKKPWFIKMHYDHSLKFKDEDSLIMTEKKFWRSDSVLSIIRPAGSSEPEKLGLPESGEIAVVGSSKGLICLTYMDHRFGIHFKVINPALRQHQFVYKMESGYTMGRGHHGMHVGFGFDDESEDFKILRVQRVRDINFRFLFCEAKVYSLRSDSWKTIQTSQDLIRSLTSQYLCTTTIGSCLYWLSLSTTLNGGSGRIVGFDLCTETFHEISPPPSVPSDQWYCAQFKHDQPLMVAVFRRNHESQFEMWTVSPDKIRINNNNNNNNNNDDSIWKKITTRTKEEIMECVRMRPVCYYRESLVPLHTRSLEVSKKTPFTERVCDRIIEGITTLRNKFGTT